MSQALSFIHLLNSPGGVKPPKGKKGSKCGLSKKHLTSLLILEYFFGHHYISNLSCTTTVHVVTTLYYLSFLYIDLFHSNHYNVLINGKLITLNKLVTYCCTAPKYCTYLPKFYVAIQSAQCPMNVAAAKRGREVKVVLANHQKSSAVCKNQFDCTSEQIGTTQ